MKLNPVKMILGLGISISLTAPTIAAVTIYPSNNGTTINGAGVTMNYNNNQNTQNDQMQQDNQNLQQQAQQNQQQQQQAQQTQQQEQSQNPGNAYDQGYGSEEEEEAQKQALEDYIQQHSPRQLGIKVVVPTYQTNWKNSKEKSIWYLNWKGILTERVGVSSQKVDFEANRLTPQQFNDWANRQLTLLNSQNIDVNNP